MASTANAETEDTLLKSTNTPVLEDAFSTAGQMYVCSLITGGVGMSFQELLVPVLQVTAIDNNRQLTQTLPDKSTPDS